MTHPIVMTRAVTPQDVTDGRVLQVQEGALVAGASAHALVIVNDEEHGRRREAGLGALPELVLLDRLMTLPLRTPVRSGNIAPDVLARLDQAPPGTVAFERGWVTRLVEPPLTVVAALVQDLGWRRAARVTAAFEPFAQRIAVLSPPQAQSHARWEAEFSGLGIWVRGDDGLREVVPPEPFVPEYSKAAGWRFAERAYRVLLNQAGAAAGMTTATRSVRSGDRTDHRAHRACAVPDPPPVASPLW